MSTCGNPGFFGFFSRLNAALDKNLAAPPAVTSAPVTSIDMPGLDLDRDRLLVIACLFRNATASAGAVQLFFDGGNGAGYDTTGTNYWKESSTASGSVVSGVNGNSAQWLTLLASGYTFCLVFLHARMFSGGTMRTMIYDNNGATTNLGCSIRSGYWTSSLNVVGIRFQSTVAASLDTGSTFTAYRLKDPNTLWPS